MRKPLVFSVLLMLSLHAVVALADDPPIDPHALVSRHNIVIHSIDSNGTMAVGNGEFAFNFDVTGLQSFPEYCEKTMPLGTLR